MTNFTTPVGRMIQGSMYNPNTKNAEGKPLLDKAGNPRNDFFFAIAIAKGAEAHWRDTEWGKVIWTAGVTGDVHAGNRPTFAWKVTDGDSTAVDQKGKRPCDKEGHRGHWVLRFSGGYAPKLYSTVGTSTPVELVGKDEVMPGYYIQVNGSVKFNGSSQQPGVYLNHSMACLRGFGPRIVGGPDVSAAGFGAAPLPVGATAMPAAGAMPPPLPVGATAMPAAGAMPPPLPAAVAAPAAVVPPPAPGFRMPPPVPPAAPVRTMLPPAGGASYEAMIAAGWTDELLVSQGMMAG